MKVVINLGPVSGFRGRGNDLRGTDFLEWRADLERGDLVRVIFMPCLGRVCDAAV